MTSTSEGSGARRPYEKPAVEDFGTLQEMTQATTFTGAEDGGSKALIHHDSPSVPVSP